MPFEPLQYVEIEAAAAALISKGGVGITVAEDHVAACKRGFDDLPQMVAARGEDQQRLGHRVHGLVQHELAQALGQRRPAGLARERDLASRIAEGLGQGVDVGGLAGPINAFKGNEKTGHQRAPSWNLRTARLCSSSVALNSLLPSPRATKYKASLWAGCAAARSASWPGMAMGVGGRPARV